MDYLSHILSNVTNFLLLFVAYVAGTYLFFLGAVFVICLRRERRFQLTPELWFMAAGCFVFLLTCATWRLLGY